MNGGFSFHVIINRVISKKLTCWMETQVQKKSISKLWLVLAVPLVVEGFPEYLKALTKGPLPKAPNTKVLLF
jgi:hypothetical protein